MIFRRNLSWLDQAVRIGGGLLLIYIGFIDAALIGDGYLNMAAGIFGAINAAAGIGGYCPLYLLADISTHCPD